jgi:uncharacterized membrane protein
MADHAQQAEAHPRLTHAGGGLMMIGGYFLPGHRRPARWRRTPVEEALPVECLPYDDRIEAPKEYSWKPGNPIIRSLPDCPPLAGIARCQRSRRKAG